LLRPLDLRSIADEPAVPADASPGASIESFAVLLSILQNANDILFLDFVHAPGIFHRKEHSALRTQGLKQLYHGEENMKMLGSASCDPQES
jgi:hypothetical protein